MLLHKFTIDIDIDIDIDLVGLKTILRTTTSFSALTLLVGSFDQ